VVASARQPSAYSLETFSILPARYTVRCFIIPHQFSLLFSCPCATRNYDYEVYKDQNRLAQISITEGQPPSVVESCPQKDAEES
jgi:hypothetical protein